jgi:putative ABC transport system substrate-binding protein
MRRRDFVTLLGGTAAWPLAARAQQGSPVARIGVLAFGPPETPSNVAFRQGLRDLGHVEGRNLVIEHRAYEGRPEQLAAFASELVKLKVDVIVTLGSEATRAGRRATTAIPIVMTSTNPLGLGFIASLSRPGGNVTGVSLMAPEISGKRLQLLQEIVPGLAKVALLWNPNDPGAEFSLKETQAAAQTLGLKVLVLETRGADDFGVAFQAAATERAEAVIPLPAPVMTANMGQIVDLALWNRFPTMYFSDDLPRAGGLVSYGISVPAISRRAAYYVDLILKGEQPANLPVEQPTKFDLVVNLTTAKAIGLTIPESFLAIADEVIE